MEYAHLEEFIDEYVKPYFPYKTSTMYNALLDFLKKYHFKDLYINNPTELKELFEQNRIASSLYDVLLMNIGVPKKLIESFSFNDKLIFLKSLSDFQRNKGSITFFKNVSNAYNDKFDVYELFADYDFIEYKWVLKPVLIHKGNEFEIFEDPIDYESVYDQVPSLLVPSSQLDEIRNEKNSAFPIKTNMVLLYYNISYDVNTLQNLQLCTFMKEYGETHIPIYLSTNTFHLSIKDLYFIWYYLLTFLYDTTWFPLTLQYLVHYSEIRNPYTLNDVRQIEHDLEQIDNSPDIYDFYHEKIEKLFGSLFRTFSSQDYSNMEHYINTFNSDFIEWFREYMDGAVTDHDKKLKINSLLNEFLASLILFQYSSQDELFLIYFDIFIRSLPQIALDPKDTVSYKILHNFKPYHVELLNRHSQSLISKDKLNVATPKEDYEFAIKLRQQEFYEELDDYGLFDFYFTHNEKVVVSDFVDCMHTFKNTNQVHIDEQLVSTFKQYLTDVHHLTDKVNVSVISNSYLSVSVSDGDYFSYLQKILEQFSIMDSCCFEYFIHKIGVLGIFDIMKIPQDKNISINVNILDNVKNQYLLHQINNYNISDTFQIVE